MVRSFDEFARFASVSAEAGVALSVDRLGPDGGRPVWRTTA